MSLLREFLTVLILWIVSAAAAIVVCVTVLGLITKALT